MGRSLIRVIGDSLESAQKEGLSDIEARERTVSDLLAHDPTLTPRVAQLLIERLEPVLDRNDTA